MTVGGFARLTVASREEGGAGGRGDLFLGTVLAERGTVCWSRPVFANKRIYTRNDKEMVCADLAAKPSPRPDRYRRPRDPAAQRLFGSLL